MASSWQPWVAERQQDSVARIMAEWYAHPKGVVFADIGWPEASSHPFHVLEGELEELQDGSWQVGQWNLHPLGVDDQDGVWRDYWRWDAYRQTPEGQPFDREHCRQVLIKTGFLPPPAG